MRPFNHNPLTRPLTTRAVLVCVLSFFFSLAQADQPNYIDPPEFSHTGGFYNQPFYLTLSTPYNGEYGYSVSKDGYQTANGTVTATPGVVYVNITLLQNKKDNKSLNKLQDLYERNESYTVTFFVDMSDSPYQSGDNVYISGNMVEPNWPEPGSNPDMQMQPLDDDPLTYTISFNLGPGEYAYKYFLNAGWGGGEWSGQPNREVSVFGNISFHDIWGVIDPEEPEGFATIVFIVEDETGSEITDATVTFDGVTYDPGIYTFDNVVPEAIIRYTTDGSPPDNNSLLHEEPILIHDRAGDPNVISLIPTNNLSPGHPYNEHWQPPAGEIQKLNSIRAATFINPETSSNIKTGSYLVDDTGTNRYSMPVISINAHSGAFFEPDTGIYVHGNHVNYSQRGREWERLVHFEFYESHGSLAFAQEMGTRIHGGTSRNRPRKSLRMYARDDYGTTWVDYYLFPDKDIERYKRFLLRNSGNDWGDVIFRDAFMQSLLTSLNLDMQYSRPAIVFINGEYWGIHNIRDRLDNRYLQTHYGIEEEMDYTILEKDAEFDSGNPAGIDHYLDMFNFLNNQGVTDQNNYNYINTQMDVENFADHQIAHIYFMNTDWPGNNLQYWRFHRDNYEPDAPYGLDGRWRWQVFDTDFGFGLNFDYVTGVEEGPAHNTLAFALEPNGPSWPNPPWSTLIFRRLVENEDFRNYFILRFQDLLNTIFHEQVVVQKLEAYRELYLPEMAEHIHRWRMPHDMDHWESEIDVMRDFALERPGYMRQFIADQFDLGESAEITLKTASPAHGGIRINTKELYGNNLPFTGTYFKDIPLEVAALPNPGYYFSYWEGADIANPTDPLQQINLTDNRTLTAHYQNAMVHYWHFNNLPEGTLTSVQADYSASGAAEITYPGSGDGYMDRTDGTLLNVHQDVSAGYGLRLRNPSSTRHMHIEASSEGYKDIRFSFAAHRTTNGAQGQSMYYSVDAGANWITLEENYYIHTDYNVFFFDLSDDDAANDNPDLQFKIHFEGDEAANEDGNNRFDNMLLSGAAINLRMDTKNPPAGFLNDIYPDYYFSASGGTPPYSFELIAGTLPEGLSLSEQGMLSGIPNAPGGFAFIIEVTDQAGSSDNHLFSMTVEEMSLIHYWHFNNLGNEILDQVITDHSLTTTRGNIAYPGTGAGYMDRTDGTLLNAKLNAEAGYALRVRNPSDTRHLILNVPTTGYENIVFSFAVQRTSNGARQQSLEFSADQGSSWTIVEDSYTIGLPYAIRSFDLSDYPEVNDNPDLRVRISFLGNEAAGASGNNRFDNIALQGKRFDLSSRQPETGILLKQNYPNPFHKHTIIPFEVIQGGGVRIDIFNMEGFHIKRLLKDHFSPGYHEVPFDASSLPPGIYFYRIETGAGSSTRRMIIM